MGKKTVHLDFETACPLELGDHGASKTAKCDELVVTTMAWAFGDDPVQSKILPGRGGLPEEIVKHIKSGGIVEAWNASFEQAILKNYFGMDIPPEQFSCTMQRALYAGYPPSLALAGDAMGVEVVKDKSARQLMLKMAKPRKASRKRGPSWWHEDQPELLEPLTEYCRKDVEAERECGKNLPELPEREKRIANLDRVVNGRGLRFDIPLIDKMIAILDGLGAGEKARVEQITGGLVTDVATQSARLVEWLAPQGITSVAKGVVAEALAREDLSEDVRTVLEIRQAFSKSSVAKLYAMKDWAESDDRARGLLFYYGAKTGRWSGRGPQPQNYFKATIKDVSRAIWCIDQGMDAHGLEIFFGAPLDVIASCLRGCILPGPGKKLAVLDLNAIEARTTAYLADQKDVLEVFENGGDVYQYIADRLGLPSRQAGKAAQLGLGYGLGAAKFVDYAAGYGLNLTPEESKKIVDDWRSANSNVSELWRRIEDCVREAILDASKSPLGKATIRINDSLSVQVTPARNKQPLMTLTMPSGRMLFYRNVAVEEDPIRGRDSIAFDGYDKGKWKRLYTYGAKLFENLNQALARDILCEMVLDIEGRKIGEMVLTVHDEVLVEVPAEDADARFEQIKACMNTSPSWTPGLAVKAAGSLMDRYEK